MKVPGISRDKRIPGIQSCGRSKKSKAFGSDKMFKKIVGKR